MVHRTMERQLSSSNATRTMSPKGSKGSAVPENSCSCIESERTPTVELRGIIRHRTHILAKVERMQRLLDENQQNGLSQLKVLSKMLTSHYNEYIQLHGMIVTRVEGDDEFEEQEKVYIAFEKLYCAVASRAEDLCQRANENKNMVPDEQSGNGKTIQQQHQKLHKKSAQGMKKQKVSQNKEIVLLREKDVQYNQKQNEEPHVLENEQTQDQNQNKSDLNHAENTECDHEVLQQQQQEELEESDQEQKITTESAETVILKAKLVINYLMYNWGSNEIRDIIFKKPKGSFFTYRDNCFIDVWNFLTNPQNNRQDLTKLHYNALLLLDNIYIPCHKTFLSRHLASLSCLGVDLSSDMEFCFFMILKRKLNFKDEYFSETDSTIQKIFKCVERGVPHSEDSIYFDCLRLKKVARKLNISEKAQI